MRSSAFKRQVERARNARKRLLAQPPRVVIVRIDDAKLAAEIHELNDTQQRMCHAVAEGALRNAVAQTRNMH